MSSLPMPDFPGKFDGQCRTLEVRVRTGKRYPWTPPGQSEAVWLPVMESRVRVVWAWDAVLGEWTDGDTWAMRRRAMANRTGDRPARMPSKNDFDSTGRRVRR
jgi:hypothetical protein